MIQGVFDFTGGSLQGFRRDPNVDEYERKEQLRQQKRRPIWETIEELGEGRGNGISSFSYVVGISDSVNRHLWPWIPRAKSG